MMRGQTNIKFREIRAYLYDTIQIMDLRQNAELFNIEAGIHYCNHYDLKGSTVHGDFWYLSF